MERIPGGDKGLTAERTDMVFADAYKECLRKTEEKKAEYTDMYRNACCGNSLCRAYTEKEARRLPAMLARDFLDLLCEAVAGSDPMTEEEQEQWADEIGLYMRYQDFLGGDREAEIEWDELPDEARFRQE